jgi:hypothetical protein
VFEGPEVKTFSIIPNVNAKFEATSELIAEHLPIRHSDIRLKGESTASVWVLDLLTGKWEGKSLPAFSGNPIVEYSTQGEAVIQTE